MLEPGAIMSGLILPSQVGPMLEVVRNVRWVKSPSRAPTVTTFFASTSIE